MYRLTISLEFSSLEGDNHAARVASRRSEFTLRLQIEVTMIQISKPDFNIGKLLATPAAMSTLENADVDLLELAGRNLDKNWGDLSDDDKRLNDQTLHDRSWILWADLLGKTNVKVWIITESPDKNGDLAATTALLPEEY